ncbi:MAG: hypothetical protein ACTHMS_22410 [Jatrophihabitans sp.]|uniref:hypothetical protein n=1 Tax=Jatrophihabitans sp. TaxID=1932789 RepID=UPI003F7E36AD
MEDETWPGDLSRLEVIFDESDDGATFRRLLREHVLVTVFVAGRQPGTDVLEPHLAGLLNLIEEHPQHRGLAEREMCRYAARLAEDPCDFGLEELLQYSMATLRWPAVLDVVEKVRDTAQRHYDAGRLRSWNALRRAEEVIEAFDESWPHRDMFARYRD